MFSSAVWLVSSTYYNSKEEPVQVVADSYTGTSPLGTQRTSTLYRQQGEVAAIKTEHSFSGTSTTTFQQMGYDPAGRATMTFHTINGQTPVTLSNLTYDETGRNTQKALGAVQTVDYSYNIRNWLTTINTPGSLGTDKFAMELFYNNASGIPGSTVQYAGNISAVKWQQQGGSLQSYYYLYDNYSRMTGGTHSGGNSEQGITYDANGNIGSLNRTGTQSASMSYNYSGNRLSSIVKGGTTYSYAYDSNGNTTTDGLRAMTLTYNQLNLPKRVSKGTDNLDYLYDARGNKLAVKVNGSVDKYYTGEIVYTSGRAVDYILTPEGMAIPSGGTFAYQYNLTDHLGNVRAVVNQNGIVDQATDYYPFGMAFSTNNLTKNNYLYNGKELQNQTLSSTFFGMYDYGARYYDPVIGRWNSVDPMAEKYRFISSYVYCHNNPMNRIYPDGRDPIYGKSFWGSTKLIGDDGKDYGKAYLVKGSVKREVNAATKEGKNYAGSLAESDKVMKIPTKGVLNDVISSVDATLSSQKEQGGSSNTGEVNATKWDEGSPAKEIKDAEGNVIGAKASMNPFMIGGTQQIPSDASNMEFYWHTHPNITVGSVSLGYSTPSDADKAFQGTMQNRGFKGNTFVVGTRSNTVTFYNKSKTLITIKYHDFKIIGGK